MSRNAVGNAATFVGSWATMVILKAVMPLCSPAVLSRIPRSISLSSFAGNAVCDHTSPSVNYGSMETQQVNVKPMKETNRMHETFWVALGSAGTLGDHQLLCCKWSRLGSCAHACESIARADRGGGAWTCGGLGPWAVCRKHRRR